MAQSVSESKNPNLLITCDPTYRSRFLRYFAICLKDCAVCEGNSEEAVILLRSPNPAQTTQQLWNTRVVHLFIGVFVRVRLCFTCLCAGAIIPFTHVSNTLEELIKQYDFSGKSNRFVVVCFAHTHKTHETLTKQNTIKQAHKTQHNTSTIQTHNKNNKRTTQTTHTTMYSHAFGFVSAWPCIWCHQTTATHHQATPHKIHARAVCCAAARF